jgi:hypothetical protein
MESDDWRVAVQTLREGGSRVTALADRYTSDQTGLASVGDAAARISGSADRLKAIVAEVHALGVSAKIEAAQLSVAGVDFTVFTSEIGRLATLAEEGLGGLTGRLNGVGTLIRAAAAEGTAFERDHRQDLLEVGKRLDKALAVTSEEQHHVAKAMSAIGKRSQSVGKSVADAVVALQINDITRQRFEHVEHALTAAREIVVAGTDRSIEQDDSRRMVAAICLLQATQLAKAGQDFEGEVDRLIASLRALALEVQAIRQDSATISAQDSAAGGSLVGKLDAELTTVRTLLHHYGEASAGLSDLVATVSQAAGEMGQHVDAVHSIDADLQVMGLNATFKCGRLGNDGRALSVIAQQLRSCAGRTGELAKQLGQGLSRMVETAQSLASGGNGVDGLEASMSTSAATLGQIGHEFDRSLAAVDEAGNRAVALLNETIDEISKFQTLQAAVTRVVARLNALAKGVDIDLRSVDAEMEKRIFSLLRERYTMASEREIHALLGGHAPAAPAVSGSGDDIDDILF